MAGDIDDSFNTTHNVDFTEIRDSGNSFQDNDGLDIDVHHVIDIL